MEKINCFRISSLFGFLIVISLNYSLLYAQINDSNIYNNKNLESTWGIVTQNQINIRQYPDTYSKVIDKCNQTDVLIVTGKYKNGIK